LLIVAYRCFINNGCCIYVVNTDSTAYVHNTIGTVFDRKHLLLDSELDTKLWSKTTSHPFETELWFLVFLTNID
jgi:hypothetical protein